MYVGDDTGAVFRAFRWLFRFGRQEVERLHPDPGHFILENKAMAGGIGAEVYHAALTLYEFMEPERNSSQVEWRIVQTIPTYTNVSASRSELVAEILAAAKSWKQYAVQIEPNDIEMFLCEERDVRSLRAAVPDSFSSVPIHAYLRDLPFAGWRTKAGEVFRKLIRRRVRVIYTPYEPPKGSLILPEAANGTAILLPWVENLWGVSLHPSGIEADEWCGFQYEDETGVLFELRMPATEAKKLFGYLLQIDRMKWRPPRRST